MLTQLDLENFKSWNRISNMRLAPITGFFGTNSSGKSALLQLLLLLKQTKESTDRAQALNLGDTRSYANLGTFKDLVTGHDDAKPLRWRLAWRSEQPLTVGDPTQQRKSQLLTGSDFTLSAEVAQKKKGQLATERISYGFAGSTFTLARKSPDEAAYSLSAEPKSAVKFIRTLGRRWDLPGPIKSYGFPDQVRTYFQNTGFLADLELAYEHQIDSIFYLGPLRDFPKREYLWGGSRPVDVGTRGERTIDALLAARAQGETIGRGKGKKKLSLEEYVAFWLREFNLIVDFDVEVVSDQSKLYRVQVRKTSESPQALITDVGFGVSQILPILVLLYYVPPGSTVLLEQPEIHLHPSVQSGLADLFIDAVRVRSIQLLVESHSEHFLRRLQRRVAEEQVNSGDVALYFCQVDEGVSKITPLELDLFGNIENWPNGFFGNDFGEIAAMQEAALKRKTAAE